jgi:hypothetical protein
MQEPGFDTADEGAPTMGHVFAWLAYSMTHVTPRALRPSTHAPRC